MKLIAVTFFKEVKQVGMDGSFIYLFDLDTAWIYLIMDNSQCRNKHHIYLVNLQLAELLFSTNGP